MIIPLDKLLMRNDNKYVFTKALMKAVDKLDNIKDYPEENRNWKVVPNIMRMFINGELKYKFIEQEKEEEQ